MRSKLRLLMPCALAADARMRQRVAAIEARMRAKLHADATLAEQLEAMVEIIDEDQ